MSWIALAGEWQADSSNPVVDIWIVCHVRNRVDISMQMLIPQIHFMRTIQTISIQY